MRCGLALLCLALAVASSAECTRIIGCVGFDCLFGAPIAATAAWLVTLELYVTMDWCWLILDRNPVSPSVLQSCRGIRAGIQRALAAVVHPAVGCIDRYLEAHCRSRIGVKTEVSNVCDPQRCCRKYTCQLARLLTGVGNKTETRRVLS